MRNIINIYCDESCHLQNDHESCMVLGAIYCQAAKKVEIFRRIEEIKRKHKLFPKYINEKQNRAMYEIKWHKVSKSKVAFYKEIIDYFFDDDDLGFRVLVIPNKNNLDHERYNQTHDTFYYKMYFNMLKVILSPSHAHHIYIDIKDTKSRQKVHRLEAVLRNDKYDYQKEIIKKVQQVRSHDVELVQLADLLIGAFSYVHRGLTTGPAKIEVIEHIKHRSGYSLLKSTLPSEKKFNIFICNL